MPKFEEPTITDKQFKDDGTTFLTYEEDKRGAEPDIPADEEGPGLMGQLWDLFRDFTDDD